MARLASKLGVHDAIVTKIITTPPDRLTWLTPEEIGTVTGHGIINREEHGQYAKGSTPPINDVPSPRYSLNHSGTKVIEVVGLDASSDCHPAPVPIQGKIAKRTFEQSGHIPESILIEGEDGVRTHVNIYPDLTQTSAMDRDWIVHGLQYLTRIGELVRVHVKMCGAAGRVLMADRLSGRRE